VFANVKIVEQETLSGENLYGKKFLRNVLYWILNQTTAFLKIEKSVENLCFVVSVRPKVVVFAGMLNA
jgi:hypothetical protein